MSGTGSESNRYARRHQYRFLKFYIPFFLLKKRKLTPKKILNALHCYLAYFLRLKKSAPTPLMINFELWNECNESCVYCRTGQGDIYDQNPGNPGGFMPKGQMPRALYEEILNEVKDRLFLSVPYINGEPLIYRPLAEIIAFSTKNRVATMIATNGILLDEKRSGELIAAGLDFIKIHVSGFTQPVHRIEHRRGDIETVKKNIETFVRLNQKQGNPTTVLIDYILYEHNRHELELMRKFSERLGTFFNVRPGDPRGMEQVERPQGNLSPPLDLACDWLWKVLSIDWDGSVLPCCDYAVWSGDRPYGKYKPGETSLRQIWNGGKVQSMRLIHKTTGRRNIGICSRCIRTGIAFKW
ncbi:MAG TPA: radical SAM protein [Candidatus Omnitrophota bacterium]|nr:radical SAM protein [Candidatus Omnitrophota bacterium]